MPLRRFGSTSRRGTTLLPPLGRASAPAGAGILRTTRLGSPLRGISPSTRISTSPSEPTNEGGGISDFFGSVSSGVLDQIGPPGLRDAIEPVIRHAKERDEPITALEAIGRAIGVGENVSAGVLQGLIKRGAFDEKQDIIQAFSPWLFMYKVAGSFSEVPGAIGEDLTYETVLRENTNPDSFLYKHAMPIGLAMSVFWDPLTYIGFGASTPAKLAARHALKLSHDQAVIIASRRLAKGAINPRTGVKYTEHQRPEAVIDVMTERGLPITPGDAMRLAGLPTGIRFAGAAIPGTGRVGSALATKTRKLVSERAAAYDAYRAVGQAFVPQWAARHIADDLTRSSALVKLQEMRDAQATAGDHLRDFSNALFNQGVTFEQGGRVVRGTVKSVLPEEHRAGLLKTASKFGEEGMLPSERAVLETVNSAVARATQHGIESGLSPGTLNRVWDTLSKGYEDPVNAAARYLTHVAMRGITKDLEKSILEDPRFAFRMAGRNITSETKDFLKRAPMGYQQYQHGSRSYAVVDAVADALHEMRNDVFVHHQFENALNALNWTQNWWKIYATVPNPSFHLMNFAGAVWNNILAGVYNPMDYTKAGMALYRSRLELAAEEGRKTALAPIRALRKQAPKSTAKGRTAQELVHQAEIRGGLGRSSFIWAESEKMLGNDLFTVDPRKGLQKLYKIPEDLRAPTHRIVTREGEMIPKGPRIPAPAKFAVRRTRQATAVALAATGNPLAVIAAAPEFARVGRRLGGTIEDLVRLTPFMKYSDSRYYKQALEAFGPVQFYGNLVTGFTKKHQRAMYDIGASISREFQFDYTNLTQFERWIAKTIFPFYTFYRKNFTLQARELIKQPGKLDTTLSLMNFIEDEGGQELGPFGDILPAYFDNLAAFQVPVPKVVREHLGLPADSPLFINPKLPFVSLNMFPPFWQLFQDTDTPTAQKMGAVMAPILGAWGPMSGFPGIIPGNKIFIEATVNRNLGLNRPIDLQRARSADERENFVPAPGWAKWLPEGISGHFGIFYSEKRHALVMHATPKYVLEQFAGPFINNFGQAVPVSTSETDIGAARADAVSWMTGLRLMPADMLKMNRNYFYHMQDLLESKRAELRERGEELSPEDDELLDDVRRGLKRIEKAWDQREEELYGN